MQEFFDERAYPLVRQAYSGHRRLLQSFANRLKELVHLGALFELLKGGLNPTNHLARMQDCLAHPVVLNDRAQAVCTADAVSRMQHLVLDPNDRSWMLSLPWSDPPLRGINMKDVQFVSVPFGRLKEYYLGTGESQWRGTAHPRVRQWFEWRRQYQTLLRWKAAVLRDVAGITRQRRDEDKASAAEQEVAASPPKDAASKQIVGEGRSAAAAAARTVDGGAGAAAAAAPAAAALGDGPVPMDISESYGEEAAAPAPAPAPAAAAVPAKPVPAAAAAPAAAGTVPMPLGTSESESQSDRAGQHEAKADKQAEAEAESDAEAEAESDAEAEAESDAEAEAESDAEAEAESDAEAEAESEAEPEAEPEPEAEAKAQAQLQGAEKKKSHAAEAAKKKKKTQTKKKKKKKKAEVTNGPQALSAAAAPGPTAASPVFHLAPRDVDLKPLASRCNPGKLHTSWTVEQNVPDLIIAAADYESLMDAHGFVLMCLPDSEADSNRLSEALGISISQLRAVRHHSKNGAPCWEMCGGPVAAEPDVKSKASPPREFGGHVMPSEGEADLLTRWTAAFDSVERAPYPKMHYAKHVSYRKGVLFAKNQPRHPLNLDAYANAPQSLMSLLPSLKEADGIARAYGYFKKGDAIFRMHVEQFMLAALTVIVKGASLWHIVRAKHMPAFRLALVAFLDTPEAVHSLGLTAKEWECCKQQLKRDGEHGAWHAKEEPQAPARAKTLTLTCRSLSLPRLLPFASPPLQIPCRTSRGRCFTASACTCLPPSCANEAWRCWTCSRGRATYWPWKKAPSTGAQTQRPPPTRSPSTCSPRGGSREDCRCWWSTSNG
jgi:hypothetical protein